MTSCTIWVLYPSPCCQRTLRVARIRFSPHVGTLFAPFVLSFELHLIRTSSSSLSTIAEHFTSSATKESFLRAALHLSEIDRPNLHYFHDIILHFVFSYLYFPIVYIIKSNPCDG